MNYDFAYIKEQVDLRDLVSAILEPKGDKWVCPKCKSGTHKNKTPAFSVTPDGKHWACFNCSPEGGDCLALMEHVYGITDPVEQAKKVVELTGVEPSPAGNSSLLVNPSQADHLPTDAGELEELMKRDEVTLAELKALMVERGHAQKTQPVSTWEPELIKAICKQWGGNILPRIEDKRAPSKEQAAEYVRNYLADARANLKSAEGGAACLQYLKGRGFTDEEIERFGFGYNPRYNNAVIPWQGADYYAERRLDAKEGENKYYNAPTKKAGKKPLFNPQALEHDTIILVEGLLDAYALLGVDFDNVVSLTTDNVSNDYLELLTETQYKGVIVLALDNDERGQEGAERVKKKLSEAGFVYIEGAAAPEGYKDAGEVFQEDRDKLKAHYSKLQEQAEQKRVELLDQALAEAGLADPVDVAGDIYLCTHLQDAIPTGFETVDRALGGGLKMGLNVLGAASSMGKTTFVHQVAEHIAASGKPVLFVTIEQTKEELVSKSLSRLARKVAGNLDNGKPNPNGVMPSNVILDKATRKSWSIKKTQVLLQACEELTATIHPYMRIWHPATRPSVTQIKKQIELMQRRFNEPPVVFIDYLQLLKQENDRDTDKQATDKNVTALRDLAGELETPIFALSSISRDAYYMPIDSSSFKESGGIEYGADVLLGLQIRNFEKRLTGRDKKGNEKQLTGEFRKAKAKKIYDEVTTSSERELELVFLKNRNGAKPKKPIPLDFLPVSMLFTEPALSKYLSAIEEEQDEAGTTLEGELDEEE